MLPRTNEVIQKGFFVDCFFLSPDFGCSTARKNNCWLEKINHGSPVNILNWLIMHVDNYCYTIVNILSTLSYLCLLFTSMSIFHISMWLLSTFAYLCPHFHIYVHICISVHIAHSYAKNPESSECGQIPLRSGLNDISLCNLDLF